ncbi:MAG: endonuclease V [Candidatus Heimdallarchaeota archaeon]
MPIIQELLIDDYSFKRAEAIQVKYQNLMLKIKKNTYLNAINAIKTVVGVDISYYKKEKKDYGVACAVVWNLNQKRVEEYYFAKEQIKFPYRAGFLGFRESKLLALVIAKLPNKPEIIMCDGHGKIHPRRFGEAVHLGFALNVSTIGVAKNPYIGYYNWNDIHLIKGNKSPIWANDPEIIPKNGLNELLGYAICLKNGSKPVFVSEGYKIQLDLALQICLFTAKGHRQPEPVFLADKLSRKEISN